MTDFNQKTHDTDVGSHGGQSRQMMEVFENQEFGSIRVLQEAGKTFFCASDVAKALGYVKAKTSITTENRSGSAADAAAKEKRTEMPLSDLHPFEGHPFKVLDDELMEQTVESIKQIGVVSPLIVRPDPEGGFEILSGHRRLHAAQLAGLETVPVIVKEMDDDAAIIFMVDSNLQRENILPSERAFSYKMKLEAMKHQGQRGDLTSDQVGQKSWAVNQ